MATDGKRSLRQTVNKRVSEDVATDDRLRTKRYDITQTHIITLTSSILRIKATDKDRDGGEGNDVATPLTPPPSSPPGDENAYGFSLRSLIIDVRLPGPRQLVLCPQVTELHLLLAPRRRLHLHSLHPTRVSSLAYFTAFTNADRV